MIPKPVVDKWRSKAPWPLDDQVEQDLIISRSLIEIFNNDHLKNKVAFRGGTAIHKIVLPRPLRYSEDIDLNRLEKGPVKKIIDNVRLSLFPLFGDPSKVKQTLNSVKILFDYESLQKEKKRLKVEINTRETLPERLLKEILYEMDSDFFCGNTILKMYDINEMAGTKIRALYQRSKGRDLFDLYKLNEHNLVDWNLAINSFINLQVNVSSKKFKSNLDLKMKNEAFLEDILPLLPLDVSYNSKDAYDWFVKKLIPRL